MRVQPRAAASTRRRASFHSLLKPQHTAGFAVAEKEGRVEMLNKHSGKRPGLFNSDGVVGVTRQTIEGAHARPGGRWFGLRGIGGRTAPPRRRLRRAHSGSARQRCAQRERLGRRPRSRRPTGPGDVRRGPTRLRCPFPRGRRLPPVGTPSPADVRGERRRNRHPDRSGHAFRRAANCLHEQRRHAGLERKRSRPGRTRRSPSKT